MRVFSARAHRWLPNTEMFIVVNSHGDQFARHKKKKKKSVARSMGSLMPRGAKALKSESDDLAMKRWIRFVVCCPKMRFLALFDCFGGVWFVGKISAKKSRLAL